MRMRAFSLRGAAGVDSLPPAHAAPTPALLFDDRDPERAAPLVEAVRARYLSAHLLDCSTAGEIEGTRLHAGTPTGAVVSLERTRLASVIAPDHKARDSFAAGHNDPHHDPHSQPSQMSTLTESVA